LNCRLCRTRWHESCTQAVMALSRILVPIDFSDPAERAARFALALAERHSAEISLLHVDELPEYVSRMEERVAADVWEGYLRGRNTAVREQLDQFVEALPRFGGRLNRSVARGEAASSINAFADAQRADLVVVAPSGAGSGKHFLTGSISMQVAAHCSSPVLVIRPDPALISPFGAVFHRPLLVLASATGPEAVDLEWLARLVIPSAELDVVVRGSEVPATHVALPGYDDYLGEAAHSRKKLVGNLIKALKQEGFHPHDRTTSGDIATIALETQAGNANDLIIVGRPSEGRDRRRAVVAERIAAHAPVSVLLIPLA